MQIDVTKQEAIRFREIAKHFGFSTVKIFIEELVNSNIEITKIWKDET